MLSQSRSAGTVTRSRAMWITAIDSGHIAGLLLFILAAQFMVVIMLGASIAPAYDYPSGAISDLGVMAETAILFNISLIAVGLLNVAGGYLYYRSHQRRGLLAIFVLAGVGAAGAGLVPLDRGALHGIFALLAFVFFNIQAIATGRVVKGPMRAISFLAGAVGLVFVGLMAVGDAGYVAAFGPIGHGGTERMIVYPAMLWMLAFGGFLMAGRTKA
jgi:hypothetical membrane protein